MATVSNRARAANIATLTTGVHGFSADEYVTITSVAAGYNNDHARILTAPSPTTFTYESIDDDEASVASSGTVVAGVSLSVAEVLTYTGKTVTADLIEVASNTILDQTKRSPTQHRDDRLIPKTDVKMAWAVVAARLVAELKAAGDEGIVQEAQDGYSYVIDPTRAQGLMSGTPNSLLALDHVTSLHVRPGNTVYR